MLEVEIRPALPDDLNLIRKSWMRSYRNAEAMEWVDAVTYDKRMPERIAHILSHPNTRTFMASPPGDTITAFGFIVAGPTCLHYVWTKDGWRRNGIARRLAEHAFPQGIATVSHVTRMGHEIWQAKTPTTLYDPFGASQ